MSTPLNVTKPDTRPIEWMFVKKTRKTTRFAEGDDLEDVLIIPAREDEDNTFPEDITEYYIYDDEEDDEDDETDDSDEDADSPYGQLGKWAEENRDASAVDVYKKADDLGIAKKHKAVQVLAQTLFDENVVEQITTFAPVFKKVHCSSMCRCSYSR